MRRLAIVLCGVSIVLLLAGGIGAALFLSRDEPDRYASIEDHFKFGSIGAEARYGVPERIWMVLPSVFADLLPPGQGEGWARFGFLYEEGRDRPIGTSRREDPVSLIGVNCAACHTGTVRVSASTPPRIVLGMPANQFDLRAYITFLRKVGNDPRFTADRLIDGMKDGGQKLSFLQEAFYRYLVIPETRKALQEQDEDFAWFDSRPEWGPGRVDTFNPYKVYNAIALDDTIGTSDLPTIFRQREKDGMYLHWDGNNNSLTERNKSAAIGAGASPASLDLPSMKRIEDWIADLPAPAFPGPIDRAKADAGRRAYAQACASCHDVGGSMVGQVTPLGALGTDPHRLRSFTPELAAAMNTIGEGRPWRFSHFRTTDGYANAPLDAVWLRSPYLHNGSVPTLRALLFPEERPPVFYRNHDVYDFDRVGFVSSGPAAEATGFRYDTRIPGNANTGHLYGTELPPATREAIIEYLKTR